MLTSSPSLPLDQPKRVFGAKSSSGRSLSSDSPPTSPLPTPPSSSHSSVATLVGVSKRPRTPPPPPPVEDRNRKIPVLPKLPTLPSQNFVPPDPSKKPPVIFRTGSGPDNNGVVSHVVPVNAAGSYTGMVDAIKQGVKLKKVDPPVRLLESSR